MPQVSAVVRFTAIAALLFAILQSGTYVVHLIMGDADFTKPATIPYSIAIFALGIVLLRKIPAIKRWEASEPKLD